MTKNEVKVMTMVLILEGNSEIGAHLWSDLGYLIWSRHFFRSRADLIFFKNKIYLPSHLSIIFQVTIQYEYAMINYDTINHIFLYFDFFLRFASTNMSRGKQNFRVARTYFILFIWMRNYFSKGIFFAGNHKRAIIANV